MSGELSTIGAVGTASTRWAEAQHHSVQQERAAAGKDATLGLGRWRNLGRDPGHDATLRAAVDAADRTSCCPERTKKSSHVCIK